MKKLLLLSGFSCLLVLNIAIAQEGNLSIPATSKNQKPIKTFRDFDNVPIKIMEINGLVKSSSPEEKAIAYIKSIYQELGFNGGFEENFVHYKSKSTTSGDIIRFKQQYKGLMVDNNQISIKFNKKGWVRTLLNGSVPIKTDIDNQPAITASTVLSAIHKYGRFSYEVDLHSNELIIHLKNSQPNLCYRVSLTDRRSGKSWSVFVDANSGDLADIKDRTVNCFDSHDGRPLSYDRTGELFVATKPKSSSGIFDPNEKEGSTALASLVLAEGTGTVFYPSPTFSAKKEYDDPGFLDNDDTTNPTLDNELMSVTLEDIEFANGLYKLKGTYTEIADQHAPFQGLLEQSSPDFSYDRSDDAFEGVMCYYQIDKSLRYVKDDLGIDIEPVNHDRIRFDPNTSLMNAYFSLRACWEILFGHKCLKNRSLP